MDSHWSDFTYFVYTQSNKVIYPLSIEFLGTSHKYEIASLKSPSSLPRCPITSPTPNYINDQMTFIRKMSEVFRASVTEIKGANIHKREFFVNSVSAEMVFFVGDN